MSTAVRAEGLTKHYGDVVALDNVDLDVRRGEIYALLGLNGAGKTTLIRLLLGMVRPTSGHVELAGRAVTDRATWAEVGYLVETPSAYPQLTVRENLEVARRLHGCADHGIVGEAIELFGLSAYADRRADTLSLGNAQRLGLAKALLHRPSIVVLDEPVNALDPAGIVEIRELLMRLAREHEMTVLLSSHLLGEVARVADRIGVLHQGRMVEELDNAALAARVHTRLEIGVRDADRASLVLRDAGWTPRTEPDGLVVEDLWAVTHPEAVATALVHGGEPPTRLAVTEEDLETYFLRLVRAPEDLPEVHRAR